MSRRVLVVAYHFPPLGGVGVQRTLKFVAHLPAAGWRPMVVAPRGSGYRSMDPTLLRQLDPSLAVHRALAVEPASIRTLVRRLVSRARGHPHGGPAAGSVPISASLPDGRRASPMRRALNAAWRIWVRAVFVPDEELLWIPAAAFVGMRAQARHPADVIYSSSPPASAHLAAGVIKTLSGRRWVADFRDPWADNWSAARRSVLHEALDRWMERWVVRRADRVIFATAALRSRYAAHYPRDARRFVVIPNGYDRAEADTGVDADAVPRPRGDERRFRLVHTGSIYSEAELADFLAGLDLALARRPELRERLRVDFFGWSTPEAAGLLSRISGPVAEIVRAHGFVSRGTIIAELRAADGALVLMGSEPGRELAVPAKLYDYIGLDRPVLAIVPPGEARQILLDLNWGEVADRDPTSVADALLRLVDAPPPGRRADPEGRFDRRSLAARLGTVLDELVDGGR